MSCEAELLDVRVNILLEPSKRVQYVVWLHVFFCSQFFSKCISQVHLSELLLLAGSRISENTLPGCCTYKFFTLDCTLSTYIISILFFFMHITAMVFPSHVFQADKSSFWCMSVRSQNIQNLTFDSGQWLVPRARCKKPQHGSLQMELITVKYWLTFWDVI